MIIMRLLVLAGLVGLAYFLLKRFLTPAPPQKKSQESFQPMVRCDYCGLHLPQQEAIMRAGEKYYCSDKHAQQEESI